MGMAKDLRVCNYCVRIVRDYTHSSGAGSVIRMESRECAGSNGGTPVRRHCSIDSSINEEKGFRWGMWDYWIMCWCVGWVGVGEGMRV